MDRGASFQFNCYLLLTATASPPSTGTPHRAGTSTPPGTVVALGTLIAPLPCLVTAVELLRTGPAPATDRLPLGLSGLRSFRSGRSALLGLPAILRACLPTLIGLAMDVTILIRKDVVVPFFRRAGHSTLFSRPRRRRRPRLIALVSIYILLGRIAAT